MNPNLNFRVGVDMIEISRVERAIKRHGERFLNRMFTLVEQKYCQNQPHRLAARVAAKEAVAKAFGTGIGDIRWVDIEVLHDDRKRPYLKLHGEAEKLAEKMGLKKWEISLSHTQENALAFVVAMG